MKTVAMQKQFEKSRKALMQIFDDLHEAEADFQPKGLNNTVRWQIGHVLTTSEAFMFGFPASSTHLPQYYGDFFSPGTAPSKWQRSAPSLEELKSNLLVQTKRIKELPLETWNKDVHESFGKMGIDNMEELFQLMIFHEAMHLGQMQSIKRLAKLADK